MLIGHAEGEYRNCDKNGIIENSLLFSRTISFSSLKYSPIPAGPGGAT